MASGIWRRPKRGLTSLVALGLLWEEPRHPYALQGLIRLRHKEFVSDKPRALYHAVERLLEGGMIEEVETTREGRRPERTVYRATPQGATEFQSWLFDLLARPGDDLEQFEAAVGLMGYLPSRVLIQALSARVAALEGTLARYEASARSLRERLGLPRLFLLEHEFATALIQAELHWVTQVIDDLAQGRLEVDPSWLHSFSGAGPEVDGETPLALEATQRQINVREPQGSQPNGSATSKPRGDRIA